MLNSNGRISAESDALDGGVDRTPFVRAHSLQGLNCRRVGLFH